VQIEDIQACFPGTVMMRGSSYYVRLDPDFVRFWEIKPDDELLMSVTKLKRERGDLGGNTP